MYSIFILLAIFVASSSERLNFTVAFMPCSTGSGGTYPDSLIFYSTVFEYFFSSYRKRLFLFMYSYNYLLAFAFKVYTGSTRSSFYPSPTLNLVRTPLSASFGSFLDLTAPIKSGKSRLFIFFT